MPRVESFDERKPSKRQAIAEASSDAMRNPTLARIKEWAGGPFRSKQSEPVTDGPPDYIDDTPEGVRDSNEAKLVSEMESRKKALQKEQGKKQLELHRDHMGPTRKKGLITSYVTEKTKLDLEQKREMQAFELKEEKIFRKAISLPAYKDVEDNIE